MVEGKGYGVGYIHGESSSVRYYIGGICREFRMGDIFLAEGVDGV